MKRSKIARSALVSAAMAALGVCPVLANEQVWDDPVGDATGGDWFDSKWDINGTWVNDPNNPNSAYFWRPGTDAPVQTRLITVNQEVFAATLSVQHGDGSAGAGQVRHIHHFSGTGPLTLQTSLGGGAFGPGVIRQDGANNNKYGEVIFDVPINAPSGLLITFDAINSDSRSRGSTVVLNAANSISGGVMYHGRGAADRNTSPDNPEISRLVLGHSNALGADPAPGDTSWHLQLDQHTSSSSHGVTLVLTNDITVPHNIQFLKPTGSSGGSWLHSIGDNKITGLLDMRTGSSGNAGGAGVHVLSGTLEIAGSQFGRGSGNPFDIHGPGTLIISSDVTDSNAPLALMDGATVIVTGAAGSRTGTGSSARRGFDALAGSTMTGTGSIQSHDTLPSRIGGTLNPGSIGGAGTFTVLNSGLELTATGNLVVDLSPNPGVVGGGVNDLLVVNGEFGRLIIQDGAVLDINALTGDLGIGTYTLAQFPAGTLELAGAEGSGLTLGSIPAGFSTSDFQIIHDNDGGVLQLTVIPEPASLGLLALGGLMMLRRRR